MINDVAIQTVLVAPLDWGLGHATRMVPIIESLLCNQKKVIIATSGIAYTFLKQRFPEIQCEQLPSYKIRYSASRFLIPKLFLQIPNIGYAIYKEHDVVKLLVQKYKIDMVISDNRFGCWNKSVRSVFITHQLNILLPSSLKFFTSLANRVNAWFINKYNSCWIPDSDIYCFAQLFALNKRIKTPCTKIGFLSRFAEPAQCIQKSYDFLCILSGPEPQRAILQTRLELIFSLSKFKVAIVCGKILVQPSKYLNIENFGLVHEQELLQLMKISETIICRSGYSSLMDLFSVGRSAILIPTPGQTEQEVLANDMNERGLFVQLLQNDISYESICLAANSIQQR